jgi:asparaginyl-tRNA synthetase
LKKAKTLAEGEKKTAAKAHELALRKKKEDEEREKVLEEAKKIVVKEDPSLPKAKRIRLWQKDAELIGQRVRVYGRAHRVRKQAHMVFVELRDGYGYLQV